MTQFENDPFESALRQTVARKEPPPGFASRVSGRLPRAASGQKWARSLLALAASLALIMGGVQYREHRKGVEAKEQLMTALKITAEKIDYAGKKIEELNR